ANDRENDRAIRSPTCTPSGSNGVTNMHGRTAGDRDFLKGASDEERWPLPIRRDEGEPGSGSAGKSSGLGFTQIPQKELPVSALDSGHNQTSTVARYRDGLACPHEF